MRSAARSMTAPARSATVCPSGVSSHPWFLVHPLRGRSRLSSMGAAPPSFDVRASTVGAAPLLWQPAPRVRSVPRRPAGRAIAALQVATGSFALPRTRLRSLPVIRNALLILLPLLLALPAEAAQITIQNRRLGPTQTLGHALHAAGLSNAEVD